MSIADRWLLPDGVKEVLPVEARQIEALRRQLLDLFDSWGYELVMPPLIEYLESLLTGTGNDLALSTFKVTDQLTGRMMGLRADTTPQVARIDAHSLQREAPSRLCYVNSVLHTVPTSLLTGRSPLQIGAELYGHGGGESDLEVISLMLEMLQVLQPDQQLTLDLGHVGIYRALVDQSDLEADQAAELFDLLQRKALTELDVFLTSLPLSESLAECFRRLPRLNGSVSVLDEARSLFAGDCAVLAALDELQSVCAAVAGRYPQVELYLDLGELRGFNYHTGIVFAAYLPAFGEALCKGGRYDEIGRDFGRARPATGFSADLKVLAEICAGEPQLRTAIFAPADSDGVLWAQIQSLRAQGERIIVELPGQPGDAQEMGCDRHLVCVDGNWRVQPL